MSWRVVFMGSPSFSLPSLRVLAKTQHVVGVITQPDRVAGRGNKIQPPPVKLLASELDLPIVQPHKLSEPTAMETLTDWSPDVIVVAAFGQILRPAVLELPPHGSINIHASLLPRWRGASPIQAAILEGDSDTGVSLMKMDPGVDTGPILKQVRVPIRKDDTAASLESRLADIGANVLEMSLEPYLSGELIPQPQSDQGVTYAPLLKKSDGELDLKEGADSLARKVRAFTPWPGTFIQWRSQPFRVLDAFSIPESDFNSADYKTEGPIIFQSQPALRTSDGILVLVVVQPAGKRPMQGQDFLRGARGWGDTHLVSG